MRRAAMVGGVSSRGKPSLPSVLPLQRKCCPAAFVGVADAVAPPLPPLMTIQTFISSLLLRYEVKQSGSRAGSSPVSWFPAP